MLTLIDWCTPCLTEPEWGACICTCPSCMSTFDEEPYHLRVAQAVRDQIENYTSMLGRDIDFEPTFCGLAPDWYVGPLSRQIDTTVPPDTFDSYPDRLPAWPDEPGMDPVDYVPDELQMEVVLLRQVAAAAWSHVGWTRDQAESCSTGRDLIRTIDAYLVLMRDQLANDARTQAALTAAIDPGEKF